MSARSAAQLRARDRIGGYDRGALKKPILQRRPLWAARSQTDVVLCSRHPRGVTLQRSIASSRNGHAPHNFRLEFSRRATTIMPSPKMTSPRCETAGRGDPIRPGTAASSRDPRVRECDSRVGQVQPPALVSFSLCVLIRFIVGSARRSERSDRSRVEPGQSRDRPALGQSRPWW